MFMTRDQRHLVCVSEGKAATKREAGVAATITVIDVQANEIAGTVRLQRPILQFVATNDLSEIFVLTQPVVSNPGKLPAIVVEQAEAFSVPVAAAAAWEATTKIPDLPFAMALSTDQKWIYVLDRGYHNHHDIRGCGGGLRSGWVKKGQREKPSRRGSCTYSTPALVYGCSRMLLERHRRKCWWMPQPTLSPSSAIRRTAFTAGSMSFMGRIRPD